MTITAGPPRIEAPRPVRLRQLPGLDGLRAIAVVAVIVYHLNPSWLPGGFLGVDIFFVISGYLITSLLLSEVQRTGGVALRRFWARRARRLFPALGVLLLVVTVLAACVARDALAPLRVDVPASIFYVLNWHLLIAHDSYFASFGRPRLLQHLWSLSVEEQFYLIWPPVLLLLRRRLSRSGIAWAALAGAVLSAVLMAVLYRTGGNPSAVYFGTGTHAQGLLLGCALAAAIPPWRMTAAIAPNARKVLERSGLAALILVIAGLALFGFTSPSTYRGGLFLVDLAAAVVIATVAHPASRMGAALGRQPLKWLGLRSYSLYLWHWPIFAMTRPGPDLSWSTGADVVLRLALTGVAAELSYRYVERPWRDGRAQFALRVQMASVARWRLTATLAAPLVVVALILGTAPGVRQPAVLSAGSTPAARTAVPTTPPASSVSSVVTDGPPYYAGTWQALEHVPFRRDASDPVQPTAPPTSTPHLPVAPPPAPASAATEPILALGDSVLLAASPNLTATFGPAITVDAAIGRQVDAGLARLAAYRFTGTLRHYRTVMVDLGTNGAFTPAQFAQLSSMLAGVPHVVLYTVHVAEPWAAVTNGTVIDGVSAHPAQMKLADWNKVAAAPGLLYPDGVHPDAAGSAAFTRLLVQSLGGAPR